ncbi:SNF2 family N-terminal domain-containing protein [Crepidotus variabilis]|uniref:SNF2 family N-terminal domain-containing protein n=1 Tax=Crepidotus variabilis TaxID=179855 RepID=A0A9P6EDU6_9AGAR|nr:SNF2 family N-terminal domain-containing protein [Crepidotus variabilis]
MADFDPSTLLNRAKAQLGLPLTAPDAQIPPHYLTELEKHLILYPEGYKFRVTLHGGKGFGSLKCLEAGCGEVISLKRRFGGDGGKRSGFGSLSNFRAHLADHNEISSFVEEAKPAVHPVDTGVNTSMLEASIDTRSLIAAHHDNTAFSIAPVKAEVLAPTFPRKRLSDDAFNAENRPQNRDSAYSPLNKKPRTGPNITNPLTSVTNRTVKGLPDQDQEMLPAFHAPGPMQRLQDIRLAIAGQQSNINRVSVKPRPSPEELLFVRDCQNELQRLLQLQQACYQEVAMHPSSSNNSAISQMPQQSSHQQIRPLASSQVSLKREPVEARPFPMDIDVKPIFDPPANGATVDQKPVIVAGPSWGPQKSEPPPFFHKVQAQASTSRLPRPSAPAELPRRVLNYSDSDDSDENDNNYEYDLDASAFMNRIGMKAPAPIIDDGRDSDGDFHGRGKDLYEGPRATQDDLQKFLLHANAETFDGNASVDKALERLGLKSLNDTVPGMEITLMAHQAIGVAWMMDKEAGVNKGGCLADEMGLGKTVQMMAAMLMNPPKGKGSKTTLIIAPLALLDQWKTEIEEKTNCGLQCYIYHGAARTTSRKKLLAHDVVLTTFNTLSREWPDYENEMKRKKQAKKRGDAFIASDDDDDMKDAGYRQQKRKEKAGLLFQVEFYRTILDEGQNIRNRRTRVSRAVVDIQATYRWCLTGTPIVNTLSDAFGYLRFLKIRPWYDWAEFNERIARKEKKNPALAITRLHAITNTFLLRRKKDTKLDGKPLIELPEKEVKMIKLEFSKEERDIYSMIEARNQAIFNRFLRAGTVLKNYHQVLVLLLRLRQICSHASLIAEGSNALVSPDEAKQGIKIVFSSELTRASRLISEEFVVKMKKKLREGALARISAEKNSTNATVEDDCPICFDLMTDAVITPCGHTFCRECIVDCIHQKGPVEAGAENENGCPCCRQALDINKLFSRSAFEPTNKELNGLFTDDGDIDMSADDEGHQDSDEDDDTVYDPKGKGKAPARPRMARRKAFVVSDDDEDDDMSDFIVESDEDEEAKDARRAIKERLGKKRAHIILDSDDELDTPEEKEVLFGVRQKQNLPKEALKLLPRFLPSSKMKYMMEQIQKLFKTKPDEKVLVISQWTSCLQLVSNYLTEKNIPHVKYQGDMSRPKREQAVKVFMAKEKAKVMLMSLKCGGVGLNLTRANNVISLDLGWSQAIESQAFDRVHRLGQKRDVLVQRVVIADTVEDRILALQERKQSLADGTLGEGSGKKMGRLSVAELANLFGLDARGRRLHD